MGKHLRAILLLPGMVTVVVPLAILVLTDFKTLGSWSQPTAAHIAAAIVGAGFIAIGLTLVVATIRLFATIGRGTLAPWDPTARLVVVGVYRRVRNPMISGVLAILLGEALVAASPPLLIWFASFLAGNLIYIPTSEEPGLTKRFGADYDEYRSHVPRWIPRLTPWQPPEAAT